MNKRVWAGILGLLAVTAGVTWYSMRPPNFAGRVYRIENPVTLFWRPGGSTHRVVAYDPKTDMMVAHCVPAPGVGGCVLRWQNKDPKIPPVTF